MTTLGLGRTAWGIVIGMALLNMYAILPTVSGVEFLAALVFLPVGSYVWVRILRFVWVRVLGSGSAGGEQSSVH